MIFKIFWIVSEIMSRLFPVKFKKWIYDEFLPLFAMVGVLFFYSAFSLQFSLIAYTCWKSKGWILFWLGYHLWVQYDLKSEKTLKRKWVTIVTFIGIIFTLAVNFLKRQSGASQIALLDGRLWKLWEELGCISVITVPISRPLQPWNARHLGHEH